jgi:hypothetical protein
MFQDARYRSLTRSELRIVSNATFRVRGRGVALVKRMGAERGRLDGIAHA